MITAPGTTPCNAGVVLRKEQRLLLNRLNQGPLAGRDGQGALCKHGLEVVPLFLAAPVAYYGRQHVRLSSPLLLDDADCLENIEQRALPAFPAPTIATLTMDSSFVSPLSSL
jgi:hypothetical protein